MFFGAVRGCPYGHSLLVIDCMINSHMRLPIPPPRHHAGAGIRTQNIQDNAPARKSTKDYVPYQ